MRTTEVVTVLLTALSVAAPLGTPARGAQAPLAPSATYQTAPTQHVPSIGSLKCEALSPSLPTSTPKVVSERIAPNTETPTGNIFFFIPRPYKYVVAHLNPTSTDVAPYAVKLI